MAAALGQSITIVNKSGKVVSTSKHLVNVFKEAKSAYHERKAELKARRKGDLERIGGPKAVLDGSNETPRDRQRRRSSAQDTGDHDRQRRTSRQDRHHRPPVGERGFSDSFYTNDSPRPYRSASSLSTPTEDFEFRNSASLQRKELVRRHSSPPARPSMPRRTSSRPANNVNLDLAYGPLPGGPPDSRMADEEELRGQMTKLQMLLDEANCLQHSVTAIIDSLSKNPDALAAVALTLAEISNIAVKMAPGVLTAMKGSFPVVIALLASPQFLIAAGVGVGVTVVAFGGYKIIKKKIKEKKAALREGGDNAATTEEMDELQEVGSEIGKIDTWRRGIADVEVMSAGTSVDGEFITPAASRIMLDQGVIGEDKYSRKSSRSTKKERREKEKDRSETSSGRFKRSKERKSGEGMEEKSLVKREKEPSGLRLLFKKERLLS